MDFNKIAAAVGGLVRVAVPLMEGVLTAEAGPIVGIAGRIVTDALAGVPAAVALVDIIKGGHNPTADDIKKYMADYDAAHDELNSVIKDKIAQNNKNQQQNKPAPLQQVDNKTNN